MDSHVRLNSVLDRIDAWWNGFSGRGALIASDLIALGRPELAGLAYRPPASLSDKELHFVLTSALLGEEPEKPELRQWQRETIARWRVMYDLPAMLSDAFIWDAWTDMSGFGSAEEDEEMLIAFLREEAIRLRLH